MNTLGAIDNNRFPSCGRRLRQHIHRLLCHNGAVIRAGILRFQWTIFLVIAALAVVVIDIELRNEGVIRGLQHVSGDIVGPYVGRWLGK